MLQLRYVFSELGTGLRRNLSMHLAVILTIFVSLTLAGCGQLMQRQADLTAEVLGNELQIMVNLCVAEDAENLPNCASGAVTEAQQDRIESALEESPEVASVEYQSQQEGYDKARQLGQYEESLGGDNPVITVDGWPAAYWVTLEDPNEADGVVSAVSGLDGVRGILDPRDALTTIFDVIGALKYGSWITSGLLLFAALLLVANTIRLAALARRREIAIMRLVGASTLYITLPFLLEALVTAVIGVGLAGGALAAFQEFALNDGLSQTIDALPWVGWDEFVDTLLWGASDGAVSVGGRDLPLPFGIVFIGPALTLIPTLLLTRKYIKV